MNIETERNIYREYYDSFQCLIEAQKIGSANEKYLPSIERFEKAKDAVKRLRDGD